MPMKKIFVITTIVCLLLAGCTDAQPENSGITEPAGNMISADAVNSDTAEVIPPENARTIHPLPDTTMDNLSDAILSVSLNEGGAYVDDQGRMQMDLKIYTYDRYDMVDIAMLQLGDTIVRYSGEVRVTSMDKTDSGMICINGGLENGGFDLVTDNCGIYFESEFDDAKNWYEIGEATIRVSADFRGTDFIDPEKGEVILYPGDFLVGAVTDYNFTPYNTTVRTEDGQIVEMNRIYIP